MIILIITILAILQYLYVYLFKPKFNTLACGIFAQLTKNPNSISVPEFNILGIYNIERGKNSCGVTFDGDIHHGINADKLYIDFIKNRNLKPKLFPSIIGHTRQASYGNVITLDNAHPFGFGQLPDNGGYAFVGVHNGTLKNHEELADNYNIEVKVPGAYTTPYNTRTKIDSEILLEILYQEENFKVLSEYVGAAALVWSWNKEPNKVYLFSGASRDWDNTYSKITEERPLCVYLRSKNNMFVSSLLDSLTAIGGNKENSFQIEYNTVYCVTDGDFKNAETWKISREKVSQNETTVWASDKNKNLNNHSTNTSRYDEEIEEYYANLGSNNSRRYPSMVDNKNTISLNIHEEKMLKDQNEYGKKVYFNKLRYQAKGHNINGVHTYIKGYGFYFLAFNMIDARSTFNELRGRSFINGEFTETVNITEFVPFEKDFDNKAYFYFVEGAMMKTYVDYINMYNKKKELKAGQYLPYRDLSYVSRHPVINISTSGLGTVKNQEILFDGVLCNTINGGICPLGSEKIYYITGGNLNKVVIRTDNKEIKTSETPVIQLPMNFDKAASTNILNSAVNNIIAIEKEEVEKEKFKDYIQGDFLSSLNDEVREAFEVLQEEEDNDVIEGIINEDLTEPLQEIINLKSKLEKYFPNVLAKESVEVLDQILDVVNVFMLPNNLNKK